jgi:hypothetical protein
MSRVVGIDRVNQAGIDRVWPSCQGGFGGRRPSLSANLTTQSSDNHLTRFPRYTRAHTRASYIDAATSANRSSAGMTKSMRRGAAMGYQWLSGNT